MSYDLYSPSSGYESIWRVAQKWDENHARPTAPRDGRESKKIESDAHGDWIYVQYL